MTELTVIEGKPIMTRKGFEKLIAKTYGDDALAAVKDTIEPCNCSSDFCRGWRLDVDKLVDAMNEKSK